MRFGESITERGDDDFMFSNSSHHNHNCRAGSRRRQSHSSLYRSNSSSSRNANRVVVFVDDSQHSQRMRPLTGETFELMKSKLAETSKEFHENDDDDDESSSFYTDNKDIRETLDYQEDDFDDLSYEDDPTVIEEADRVEQEIRKNMTWVFLAMIATKLFAKIMECLCGGGGIEQEVTAHVAEDVTNSTRGGLMATSSGAGQGGGGGATTQ